MVYLKSVLSTTAKSGVCGRVQIFLFFQTLVVQNRKESSESPPGLCIYSHIHSQREREREREKNKEEEKKKEDDFAFSSG